MQSIVINDKLKVVQGDDQIYKYIAINKCTLDMEMVKEMTRVGDAWNGTRLCANLVDMRDLFFIDSRTREYAAAQYRPHLAGQAILIESHLSSYFANLFLKFSKPKVPTKLFTKENEALEWLKEKMQKRSKN
jgi:hypothetical protein